MNVMEWSSQLVNGQDGVRAKMRKYAWSPEILAAAANLGERTVRRFVDGLTFEPHLRTAMSCSQALGANMELWEKAMFVHQLEQPRAPTVQDLRKRMKKCGFTGYLVERKDGIILGHRNGCFKVKGKVNAHPVATWIKLALEIEKRGNKKTKISVAV